MKVLFACRPQIFEVPGGDTVQLLKMQKYLAECGVDVAISPNPADIARENCDLVHVFNLFDVDSMAAQAKRAKAQDSRSSLPRITGTRLSSFLKLRIRFFIV